MGKIALKKIVEDASVAMLVTRSLNGTVVSHPMKLQETRKETEKIGRNIKNPKVNVDMPSLTRADDPFAKINICRISQVSGLRNYCKISLSLFKKL